MTDKTALASEVHVFFLGPFLDDAEDRLGRDVLEAELRARGASLAQLRDPTGWMSLEFAESFISWLHPPDDHAYFQRMGRASVSARYMGMLRPILRAFGTPTFGYRAMAGSLPRFNKVGVITIEQRGPRDADLHYTQLPGAPRESNVQVCLARQGQIEAIPVLFDLPPAQLDHPMCLHRGDHECLYRIHYEQPDSRWRSTLGFLLGATAAIFTAVIMGAGALAILASAFAAAIGGWSFGRWLGLSGQVEEQALSIAEQQDALLLSVRANEDRFAELLQAKLEVDAKVEERTADLERTSARLAETLAEVRALDRAKTDFFSNVSHELRTPLTLMMSPLEHMARGEEPPGGRAAALDAMQRNARRLLTMINQLLDLARSESGEATIERMPIALEDFVGALKTSFEAAAVAKSVELEFDAAKARTMVALDPRWLETALTNLLANGLRFSDAGGKLRLRVEDTGDEVVFEVSDEGPGIPVEEQQNLFERFARGSSSRSGTGLGLALVAQAARLHGGRVEVSSVVGEGATFRLHLPRVMAQGEAVALTLTEQIAERHEPAVPESRVGPDATAPLALVVEDNPDVRRFICDVLAARYRVSSATNGRAALALAREEPPDVIVSDVSMPEMNGLEFTRAVREDAKIRDVPIVLVTARGEPEQILAGFDAGAQDYVTKPFHGRELLARTDALVRARRLAGRFAHRERLATLGITAASVAHHIRNPLNALIAGLPAVQRRIGEDIDESTKRMFEVFIDCAERIERVTADLLDLSRVDRQSEGRYSPGRGLRACVRLMETRFGDGLQLTLDVDEETEVIGRAGDMHSVFLNLLDNAARAVEGNGRLHVTGGRVEDVYEVRVADAGAGVPDELKERIFEPFVTTRTGGEGTGLGLAIARDVATQHGGTIHVEGSDLGGAEFIIRLPVAC